MFFQTNIREIYNFTMKTLQHIWQSRQIYVLWLCYGSAIDFDFLFPPQLSVTCLTCRAQMTWRKCSHVVNKSFDETVLALCVRKFQFVKQQIIITHNFRSLFKRVFPTFHATTNATCVRWGKISHFSHLCRRNMKSVAQSPTTQKMR